MQDAQSGRDRINAVIELQQLLLDTENISDFLNELACYATTVGPALSCGITLERDGNPLTVASSDTAARGLDEVQYGHDSGPCLTAMRTGGTVIITDLVTDDRWGDYRFDALAHGIAASLSVPLKTDPGVRGALNLYSGVPAEFGPERQQQAEGFADEASRALRLADQAQLTRNLEVAMAARSIIDQAIGIIMGQNRCTATDAFDILRRASNHRNVKLKDVASQIVTRISGKPPAPGGAD